MYHHIMLAKDIREFLANGTGQQKDLFCDYCCNFSTRSKETFDHHYACCTSGKEFSQDSFPKN